MLPTRGLIIAFSKNSHGRTAEEANRLTYTRNTDTEKIIHLRSSCSGMNDPQVHYIPVELAGMMRWCGACADYGREVQMPNYCPCCDQILGPGDSTDIVRYARHKNSHLVDHHGPTRTCDEMYKRRVLNKAREFLQF